MNKTQISIYLLLLITTPMFSSNIRLRCKTTKESKNVGKYEPIANGANGPKEGKIITYNQFTISTDKVLVNVDSSEHTTTVIDFNNESIITLNNLNRLYSRVPLAYIIHYRIKEFQNRNFLAKGLQAGGVEDAFGGLFSRESLFGIEDVKDFFKSDITTKEDRKKHVVKYIYKQANVVTIEYSELPIPENMRDMFTKFIVYNFYIHPIIIQKIVSSGYFPTKIEYTYQNVATETQVKMELSQFDLDGSDVNVLTDFGKMSADTTQGNKLRDIINVIYDTVLKGNFVLLNKQQCISHSQDLIIQEKYLDSILSLFEYLLQSGDTPTDAVRYSASFANKDANMQSFINALQSNISEKDKITLLASIPQEKYEKGYVINIFLGDYYANSDSKMSFDSFQRTLIKNQFITGVYKDLGDLYAKQYDMESAWRCYDIAKHINPQHPMSKDIEGLRTKLKKDFPTYFAGAN